MVRANIAWLDVLKKNGKYHGSYFFDDLAHFLRCGLHILVK